MKTKERRRRVNLITTDPAWEAMKAAHRNLDHDDAVQESFFLQKQYRRQWSDRVAKSPVDVNQIIRALTHKRIPFVLTGTHAMGGWTGRPRATCDVDILVKGGRNHARAVKVIKTLYPELESAQFTDLTAFFIPGEKTSVIDVAYPHRPDLEETLASSTWTENKEESLRYRVPGLEEALTNIYGAMLNLLRGLAKRTFDIGDFIQMVMHSMDEGQRPIDLQRLESLGNKVWSGGGAEILRLVERIKAGMEITLGSLGLASPKEK